MCSLIKLRTILTRTIASPIESLMLRLCEIGFFPRARDVWKLANISNRIDVFFFLPRMIIKAVCQMHNVSIICDAKNYPYRFIRAFFFFVLLPSVSDKDICSNTLDSLVNKTTRSCLRLTMSRCILFTSHLIAFHVGASSLLEILLKYKLLCFLKVK